MEPPLAWLDKATECLLLNHSIVCEMIWGHTSCGPMTPSHQFCDNINDYTLCPAQAFIFMCRLVCPKLGGGGLAPESQTPGGL